MPFGLQSRRLSSCHVSALVVTFALTCAPAAVAQAANGPGGSPPGGGGPPALDAERPSPGPRPDAAQVEPIHRDWPGSGARNHAAPRPAASDGNDTSASPSGHGEPPATSRPDADQPGGRAAEPQASPRSMGAPPPLVSPPDAPLVPRAAPSPRATPPATASPPRHASPPSGTPPGGAPSSPETASPPRGAPPPQAAPPPQGPPPGAGSPPGHEALPHQASVPARDPATPAEDAASPGQPPAPPPQQLNSPRQDTASPPRIPVDASGLDSTAPEPPVPEPGHGESSAGPAEGSPIAQAAPGPNDAALLARQPVAHRVWAGAVVPHSGQAVRPVGRGLAPELALTAGSALSTPAVTTADPPSATTQESLEHGLVDEPATPGRSLAGGASRTSSGSGGGAAPGLVLAVLLTVLVHWSTVVLLRVRWRPTVFLALPERPG